MIDQNGHARLADFGLLTIVSDTTNFTASVAASGTTRWMSPELLDPEQFGLEDSRPTKESDCYALGMVIYEVLSGQAPFALFKDFVVMRKVTEGERPGRPEGVKGAWFTDDLWRMLGLCWESQPERRPSIEAVLQCLEKVTITWQPPPPEEGEDEEADEGDWDLTAEVVLPVCLDPRFCGGSHADRAPTPLSEFVPSARHYLTASGRRATKRDH